MNGRLMVVGLYGMSSLFQVDEMPSIGETGVSVELIFEGGGKGYNQAVSASRMGTETVFATAVGGDIYGRDASRVFRKDGLKKWKLIEKEKEHTAFAAVCTDKNGENFVIVEQGVMKRLSAADVAALEEEILKSDMLLLQMEMPVPVTEYLMRFAYQHGISIMLNPAPVRTECRELLCLADVITPNYGEALELCGYTRENKIPPETLCRQLQKSGAKNVVITLGGDGSCLLEQSGNFSVQEAFPVKAVDTVGAGDTFNGALAAAILGGCSLRESVRIASAASAISVTQRGAVAGIPTRAEVFAFLEQY